MTVSDKAFLGTGWSFPPTFLRRPPGVVMTSAELNIHESLRVLFSTTLGERLMLAQYGTDLWRRVFGTMSLTFRTEIASSVRASVLRWEPRIAVDAVTVETDPETAGLVVVDVAYTVLMTNTRGNFVYPFYLQEATLAPAAL